MMAAPAYRVGTFRDAGLEARWTKNSRGAPIIVARDPKSDQRHQRERWWYMDRAAWTCVAREGDVRRGFDCATILGDIFSL